MNVSMKLNSYELTICKDGEQYFYILRK